MVMLALSSRYWTSVGWVPHKIKRIERVCLRSCQAYVGRGHGARALERAWRQREQREREIMAEAAKTKETITLEEARRVIDGAQRKAEQIGQPMDIAVVDAGGNLKAHVRMDGAFVASITISINKAYTAIAFQQQTAHLQEDTRPGGPIFGLSDAHGGRLVVFPGGIPLVREGEIVGAIGVSTGTVEQDQEVAEAGAASF
jgi:uncharacterized protein GlcG (DUF336 family)